MKRHPVDAPISVEFGPVYVRLLEPRYLHQPPDDGVDLPWAWVAVTTLRFRIGAARVSKRVTAKWSYPHDYDDHDALHEADRTTGCLGVVREVRRLIARHGVDAPELVIEDTTPAVLTDPQEDR